MVHLQKARTKHFVSALLALILVVLLLTQISLQDLLDLLLNVSYPWVAVGITFYVVTNVGRAFRLQVLLPRQKTRFHHLLAIVISQSMFNNVLPARTGELSLVYLLKRYQAVPLDRASVALIVARVSDFLAVAVIFVVAALISLETLPDYATGIIWAAAGAMMLLVLILLSLAWSGRRSLVLLRWLLTRAGLASHRLVRLGLEKLQQVVIAFEAVHSLRRYFIAFLWSLILWLTTFAWFYAFLQGMGLKTLLLSTIVGATFAVLSKALPFLSVGGLGTHEAGWTVGFMLVGFDKTTAIASGFAVNILTLLMSVVLGLGSLLVLRTSAPVAPAPVNRQPAEKEASPPAEAPSP